MFDDNGNIPDVVNNDGKIIPAETFLVKKWVNILNLLLPKN